MRQIPETGLRPVELDFAASERNNYRNEWIPKRGLKLLAIGLLEAMEGATAVCNGM